MLTLFILGEEVALFPILLILILLSHHDVERHDHVTHSYRTRKIHRNGILKDVL